jgi:hypothetical protein
MGGLFLVNFQGQEILHCSGAMQDNMLESCFAEVGVSAASIKYLRRNMTIEIGVHGAGHSKLPTLKKNDCTVQSVNILPGLTNVLDVYMDMTAVSSSLHLGQQLHGIYI